MRSTSIQTLQTLNIFHFKLLAMKTSGNEFPAPRKKSCIQFVLHPGEMVYKSEKKKNPKECSREGMKCYHWNLYLWEEKELNHYLRMQDYNISRI